LGTQRDFRLSNVKNFLVADVGGTNTRLGIGHPDGTLTDVQAFRNEQVENLRTALGEAAKLLTAPRQAVLAFAGPVDGDTLRLTNRPWSFSRAELERSLALENLVVVNDFVAMAHAAPTLKESDVVRVSGVGPDETKNILVCGPGTGFGAAALINGGGGRASIATEAGHMVLGPAGPEESEIFARLAVTGRPLAVEDVLSGPGLSAVHRAMTNRDLQSEDIIARADQGDKDCSTTVELFMRVLGRIAGDLALAFDARGGIFIGGGVGRALHKQIRESAFRDAFEAHHPYERRLREFPIAVIMHPFPGLIGALEIARTEFG
jgi:glucokinase